MEMYPQKRFAPGRRRINAAHHVLTQPIGTFSTVRVFLYFCVSNVTCLSGQLGFLWLCAPINCSCHVPRQMVRRGQSNVASGIKITTQTIISRTGSSTTPWKNLQHQGANENIL